MVHVALFAFPEQGHINPMLQLGLHLASKGAHATLINTEQAHHKLHAHFEHLQHTYPLLHFACIPEGLPAHQLFPNVVVSGSISHGDVSSPAMPALFQSLEKQGPAALEQLLSDLNASLDWPRLSCLICDAVMPWAAPVALKLQLSWIVFWSASATRLYLTVTNFGDEATRTEQDNSVVIPGLPPMCTDAADPLRLRLLQARCEAVKKAEILILNSFDGIEEEAIWKMALKLPVRAVGPLCLNAGVGHGLEKAYDECLSWLDKQVAHSVLYISFGSKVLLQGRPLEQLALGIEASKKAFLWVLRSSKDELPEGFLERTQERGMIMSWVPQQKVLEHSAIGAFLTHCGWNSVLEAVVEGVPMICWPMFLDQPVNRVLIEHKWRTGKGVQKEEVSGDYLRQVILDVMSDGDMRERASLLGISAKAAMSEGGISQQNLIALLASM